MQPSNFAEARSVRKPRNGDNGGQWKRKRCETGLRRTAMILSSLPTILSSIFSSLASQITEVPRQKQRTRRRVARTPESFSFSLLHYSLFPAADKDTSTQRPRRKKKEGITQREFQTRGEDGFAFLIRTYTYTYMYFHAYICIYLCMYVRIYTSMYTVLEVPTPTLDVLAPREFKRGWLA